VADRELLTLEPIADVPEVGRWLAALEDGRRDTLRELEDVTDQMLDVRPPGSENSIGTSLYHVALIEADWLFDDIFGESIEGSELAPLFPFDDRDADHRLTEIVGQPLATHVDRLSRVRQVVMVRLQPFSAEDFHTPRAREQYDVSPAWVVHHLLQHESEHRSEIGWLRRRLVSPGGRA
jgi:DinB family protein